MKKNIRLTDYAMVRLRRLVKERDGGCVICMWMLGCDLHHVVFRSSGGEDTADNLVCLCRKCHSIYAHGKHAKAWRDSFLEYLQSEKCRRWKDMHREELEELYEKGRR